MRPALAILSVGLLISSACTSTEAPEARPSLSPAPSISNPLGECARNTEVGLIDVTAGMAEGARLAVDLLNERASFNYSLSEDAAPNEVAAAVGVFERSLAADFQGAGRAALHLAPSPGITTVGSQVFRVAMTDDEVLARGESADLGAPIVLDESQSDDPDAIVAAEWTADSPSDTSESFVKRFNAKLGHDPDTDAARAYTAVVLVAAAVETECSNDPADIVDHLSSFDESASVLGPFSFSRKRTPEHPVVVVLEGPDGPQKGLALGG